MSFLFSLLVGLLAALGHGATPGDAHGGIFSGPSAPSDPDVISSVKNP